MLKIGLFIGAFFSLANAKSWNYIGNVEPVTGFTCLVPEYPHKFDENGNLTEVVDQLQVHYHRHTYGKVSMKILCSGIGDRVTLKQSATGTITATFPPVHNSFTIYVVKLHCYEHDIPEEDLLNEKKNYKFLCEVNVHDSILSMPLWAQNGSLLQAQSEGNSNDNDEEPDCPNCPTCPFSCPDAITGLQPVTKDHSMWPIPMKFDYEIDPKDGCRILKLAFIARGSWMVTKKTMTKCVDVIFALNATDTETFNITERVKCMKYGWGANEMSSAPLDNTFTCSVKQNNICPPSSDTLNASTQTTKILSTVMLSILLIFH